MDLGSGFEYLLYKIIEVIKISLCRAGLWVIKVSNSSHLKEAWRWWPAGQRLEKPAAAWGTSGNPGWVEEVKDSRPCAHKHSKPVPKRCSVIDFVWSKKRKTCLESGWDHLTCFKYSFTCFRIESCDFFFPHWQMDQSSSFSIESLDLWGCSKHAGLHLKQATLSPQFDRFFFFFFFFEILEYDYWINVRLLTIEAWKHEALVVGLSNLIQHHEKLAFKHWAWAWQCCVENDPQKSWILTIC